jgi:four helix bundle protein
MLAAQRFEDLIVWQLAVSLRRLVFQMTKSGRVTTDFKFCDQIRNSARSAPSNIAEGFRRFDPPEFAHFMKIALASLAETQDYLLHGRDEKYFPDDKFTEAWRLSWRALKAGNRLHQYLRGCPKKKTPRRRSNPEEPRRTQANLVEPGGTQ